MDERLNPAKPGKRLVEIRESVEATEHLADEIEALVARPPVSSRDAARATLRLEAPRIPGGPPLGDHPARLAFLEARETVSRRLGELVAGPRVATVAHLARAFSEAYEARKRSDECLDHDDLELETLELLRHTPAVRQRIAERFARILVDEFQDTNPRQAELVQLLAGERPWLLARPGDGAPAVTVVGDPRQAIYGFRHADVELILQAEREAPADAALRLSTNYRSDAEVLGAIDRAWHRLDPDGHQPVAAHRGPDALPGGEPRVELLITKDDSTDPWDGEALGGRPGRRPVRRWPRRGSWLHGSRSCSSASPSATSPCSREHGGRSSPWPRPWPCSASSRCRMALPDSGSASRSPISSTGCGWCATRRTMPRWSPSSRRRSSASPPMGSPSSGARRRGRGAVRGDRAGRARRAFRR